MNHLFILGAGASRQAGGPLMADFLDKAEDLLRLKTDGIVEAEQEFETVFEAIAQLQDIHAKSYLDLNNLEEVFGAIEMGKLLSRLGKRSPDQIDELRRAFVTLIYKTLENSIPFPVNRERIFPPKPYDDFASLLKEVRKREAYQDPSNFSFITFNYDLCLEYALYFGAIAYDYCISGDRPADRCPVLKLHGSINWGTSEDGEIVPYHVHEANFNLFADTKEVFFDLGTTLRSKKHKNKNLQGPPVIVPPTWNKDSYRSQLSNVWSAAAAELGVADNIIVIGYSMPETDSFFKYLYALGSQSKTRIRNLIVVNIDSGVQRRFMALIGRGIENRFVDIPKTFEQALPDIKAMLLNP